MISAAKRFLKSSSGFNMIELMVVVVILGLLTAVAVPIYSRYVRNSRVSEAMSRVGELYTAAKTFAVASDNDGNPSTAVWPRSCNEPGFLGDCHESSLFTFEIEGQINGSIKISAVGKANTPVEQVQVTIAASSLIDRPVATVYGL